MRSLPTLVLFISKTRHTSAIRAGRRLARHERASPGGGGQALSEVRHARSGQRSSSPCSASRSWQYVRDSGSFLGACSIFFRRGWPATALARAPRLGRPDRLWTSSSVRTPPGRPTPALTEMGGGATARATAIMGHGCTLLGKTTAPEGAAQRSHMVECAGLTGNPTRLSAVSYRHLTQTGRPTARDTSQLVPGTPCRVRIGRVVKRLVIVDMGGGAVHVHPLADD